MTTTDEDANEIIWITKDLVALEYAKWPQSNRNHQGRRFGEHLMCRYTGVPVKAFHIENKLEAYTCIMKCLENWNR